MNFLTNSVNKLQIKFLALRPSPEQKANYYYNIDIFANPPIPFSFLVYVIYEYLIRLSMYTSTYMIGHTSDISILRKKSSCHILYENISNKNSIYLVPFNELRGHRIKL